MFTVVGFYDILEHAELAAIAAIEDPHIRVSGNDIYIPSWNRVMLVVAAGAKLAQCRLQSPSLRRMVNQRIAPVLTVALPLASLETPRIHDFHLNPRTLDIAEALNAFCVNGAVTGNEEWVLVWLMDTLAPLPGGEIVSIEGTVTVTGVKGDWVNGALTFSQTLPAGRYALVGMRAEDTAVVAVRCVYPDISARPGCLGSTSAAAADNPLFRQGRLGNWGEFEHDAPPTSDVLCNADGAVTPEIIMDLIQVRAGRR